MKHIIDFNTLSGIDTSKEYLSPGLLFVEETEQVVYVDYGDEGTYNCIVEGNRLKTRQAGLVTLTLLAGTGGTVSGGGSYPVGTLVTISASPNQGYRFLQWSDGNISATRQILVNSDITLTATFKESLANGVYIGYVGNTVSAYNSLDSGKTPLGVVIKSDNVSLLLHKSESSRDKTWATSRTVLIDGVTTTRDTNEAIHSFSGRQDTAAVLASPYCGTAFKWASSVGFADGRESWLPSCGEYEEMRLQVSKVNTALSLLGGVQLKFDSSWRYWISTQYASTTGWCWGSTTYSWNNNYKDLGYECRAVSYWE